MSDDECSGSSNSFDETEDSDSAGPEDFFDNQSHESANDGTSGTDDADDTESSATSSDESDSSSSVSSSDMPRGRRQRRRTSEDSGPEEVLDDADSCTHFIIDTRTLASLESHTQNSGSDAKNAQTKDNSGTYSRGI